MTPLHLLWLPIVLSAIAVFVASSIIHMASPWHKNDYPVHPNEDAVLNALRPLALVQLSIWYSRSWSITLKTLVDGLIYAAITALIFTWLWPH